ncbi:MAG: ABC transporter ATP-binding protein [Phycisphaerae bacterium]
MNTEHLIADIKNLSIRFGRIQALADVNLQIEPGRIIGLLGANGSGKSTLLRAIIGLYLPDNGSCRTLGCPAAKLSAEHLAKIGYVHQEGELIDWMKAGQLIRYVSVYYPAWNHDLEERYIREFQIDLKARVSTLSPGQRQRLAILLAICFEPEFLILDEPASGLDPIARGHFLDLLLSLIQDPRRTIIISSHILSDVEKVIDHVWILKSGRVIRDCLFDDLREEFCQLHLTSLNGNLPEILPFTGIIACKREAKQALLTLQNPSHNEIEKIAQTLNCQHEIRPLSLEDIYKIVVL